MPTAKTIETGKVKWIFQYPTIYLSQNLKRGFWLQHPWIYHAQTSIW